MTTETTTAAAGIGRRPLTAHALVYGTAAAVDPQISPDGTRLVYGVARAAEDKPAETPGTRLWTSAVDGSGTTPLGDGSGRPRLARWSPDGARIAFVASSGEGDDEASAIHLVDAGGEGGQTLVQHPLGIGWLAWSPAGDRLAYSVAIDPVAASAGPDP